MFAFVDFIVREQSLYCLTNWFGRVTLNNYRWAHLHPQHHKYLKAEMKMNRLKHFFLL
jgi:hypothetical protein